LRVRSLHHKETTRPKYSFSSRSNVSKHLPYFRTEDYQYLTFKTFILQENFRKISKKFQKNFRKISKKFQKNFRIISGKKLA
jgi:hypothetical protein